MNKIFPITILLILLMLIKPPSRTYAESQIKLPPLTGEISENTVMSNKSYQTGKIVDSFTGEPVSGAKISIPDSNISTISQPDGSFFIDPQRPNGDFILSVNKDGYLPFALKTSKRELSEPFILNIQKQQGQLVIDQNLHHLGDNQFSMNSASAGNFRQPSEGPIFVQEFYIKTIPRNDLILRIGSIIGIDTLLSRQLGQSKFSSYSSPVSIYLNSVRIAEIGINSDNKNIPISKNLLKNGAKNLLIVQTGVNQTVNRPDFIDYDDIEFINLILEETK